ncbi:MAG TPA: hypothetical protein VIL71_22610 [Spirillospora sp.]
MAGIADRIRKFLHSPRGRQVRARAERLARDPRTQARARRLVTRFRGGGRRRY